MSRNKDKPIDRYPYMDNDLKGWANEFVRVETYATGFRYLDNKIDNIIVGTEFVRHEEFDAYTETTNGTLNSLQEQIDAIDVSKYVEKEEFNTYTEATSETLTNLQDQIDAIDLSQYVEKTTYNTDKVQTDERLDTIETTLEDIPTTYATKTELTEYETTTDGRLEALETITEDIPNTYATKSEFSECCEEVGERLDTIETTIETIPNTYATKIELTEYETTTDETLENIQEQIDAIDLSNYVEKTTYNTYTEATDGRLEALETITEDIPNTYTTKTELTEYETTTDETLESLQTQIDAIDTSAYVEKTTYNTDKEQTDETLESLQTQIDAIDTSAYVEKTTYNTDKAETDETLESLQTQIDAIDTSAYVEKTTYNTDKEATDGKLDALETIAEDIPNTYATKTELSECCDEVDGRLDALETIAEDIPTTYATKTELTEYETTTNTALDEIREEIENLDNYDPATDTVLGVVKTNSAKGITLNEDDQLEVDGRVGQSPYGGIYYPTTIEPTNVGNSSLLMSDGAKNLSIAARTFAILAGANLTCKSAEAGATQYRLTNTQGNRFACFAGQGGNLAIDANDAMTNGTATITDISFANGNTISAYFGVTESDNDIIITVDRTVNPNAPTTKLRIYGKTTGTDQIVIGQGSGSKGSKAIVLGQSSYTNSAQTLALGNSVAVTANNSIGLGHTHLINKQFCFAVGQGHDFTDGPNGSSAVGIASKITNDTLFAVGNGVFSGTGNTTRSNAFEVKSNGTIITGDRNITQELTDATTNITEINTNVENLGTQVESIQETVDTEHMGYAQYNFTVDNGGLAELFPDGYSNNSCEITRFEVVMSGQICNISMSIKLKNYLPTASSITTPTMSSDGFYPSSADMGKVFLGKYVYGANTFPTFELLTYNTKMTNTTQVQLGTLEIQTSWTMVAARTFQTLATRWAAYKVENPT